MDPDKQFKFNDCLMNIDPQKWIEVDLECMKCSVGDSHRNSVFVSKQKSNRIYSKKPVL